MAITKRVEITNEQAFQAILEGRDIQARAPRWASDPEQGYWVEVTHKGVVVELREENGYNDSDFYAVVWDAAEGRAREVLYATTRAATGDNGATVDAPPAIREAYEAWTRRQAVLRAQALTEREARTVRKGKIVRVVGGLKVPVGIVGTCHWIGEGYRGRTRVGLTTSDGTAYWTDVKNVEVVVEEQRKAG